MAKKKKDIRAVIEEKAREGDGLFAIAYALFDLSDSQEATAKAIQRLGNGNAATHYGAIENLAMQVSAAAETMGNFIDGAGARIATALENLDVVQR